jgi:Glu-tRNA(Gln) amidotransferase subunit E-like FAD-binding protein
MGKLVPHKYPPLIDKDLFNKVQEVRMVRHDHHTKYRSLPFAFNNFVRCKECNGMISSFYSRKHIYLTCSQAKYKCGNKNTAEALIMPDIQELVSSITLSDEQLQLIAKELKKRHGSQQTDLSEKIKAVRAEYDNITERLKALTYERLDSVKRGTGITDKLYDEMVNELTNQQQDLNQKLIHLRTLTRPSLPLLPSY